MHRKFMLGCLSTALLVGPVSASADIILGGHSQGGCVVHVSRLR